MEKRAAKVDESLGQAFDAVDRFISSPTPNEPITEIDLDTVKLTAKKARQVLQTSSDDDLIQHVNNIISDLGFPQIEHQVASRGLLVVKLQGLELISSLHEVKNQARIAGYKDPDIANIDLSSSVSKEFLADIEISLREVADLTLKLEAQLKANKQTGIAVGFGGLSVDVGVAINFLKTTTDSARNYLEENSRINAETLRSKLRTVSSVSVNLMDAIRSSAKKFGNKAAELTARIAAAANASYRNSLELIKASFSVPNDDLSAKEAGREININTALSPKDPLAAPSTPLHATSIISHKLAALSEKKRIPKHYFESGMLSECIIFESHSQYYVTFYLLSTSRKWRLTPNNEKPVSLTDGITRSEYEVFASLTKGELNSAAIEAFYQIKTKN